LRRHDLAGPEGEPRPFTHHNYSVLDESTLGNPESLNISATTPADDERYQSAARGSFNSGARPSRR
jgi:hypothetical protein